MPANSSEAAMHENRPLVALLLRDSYREGSFTLSSGAVSDFYLDAKQVTYGAEGMALVGDAMMKLVVKYNLESVGGLTMGADAIVAATVFASANSGRHITGFVVRKEPKQYGLSKTIEGVNPNGKRVAIVDDVITSGTSALKAVNDARKAGAIVELVVGLVDREQGGAEAIAAAGVNFVSLVSISQIRAAARDARADK